MPETLAFEGVPARPDLLAPPVWAALTAGGTDGSGVEVTEIDPEVADTTAFCERYGVRLDESANCVVVAGRRGGETKLAACLVLATTRTDVNGMARRYLDVRKASFASMDLAVSETGMEYGGITPFGLPAHWPLLIDAAIAKADRVIVGSGLRRSKLRTSASLLATLPTATVIEGLGQ